MSIATPAFFWVSICMRYLFHPLTFSLYVSLGLRWVSCRQRYIGVLFLYPFGQSLPMVGAFNLLTFKVIIDKHDPITIYFIVL